MDISLEILAQFNFANEEETVDNTNKGNTDYRNSTYNIVSIVGFLIGVKKEKFDDENNPLDTRIFDQLKDDKNARIIRNLCRLRNAFEKRYLQISSAFKNEIKNIGTCPELIPSEAVEELADDGIVLTKSRPDVDEYIISINSHIQSRINNCKELFPDWINWDYIKELFIMPKGLKKEGIKAAGAFYNSDRNRYPYQCYINWNLDNVGNILYCDEKFVKLIYEYHNEIFEDLSLVRAAGDITVGNIEEFMKNAEKVLIVVDCENSNPIKLSAVLTSLNDEQKAKVDKIILFDSHYTTTQWNAVSNTTEKIEIKEPTFNWGTLGGLSDMKVEHEIIERLIETKSQVDMSLAVKTTQEIYCNGIDSVILVSSDSDYWAMIKNLEETRFMVMIEREKTSPTIKNSLYSKGIKYCYMDDFYTGISYSIKTSTVRNTIQTYIDEVVSLNGRDMLATALKNTWIEMSEKEQKKFYDKYIKKAHLAIDENGNMRVVLGEKGEE